MKPSHVKAVVVVAATAVGADVREGEAVNGVEVVAEDATNNFLIVAAVLPLPVERMLPRGFSCFHMVRWREALSNQRSML